MNVETLLRLLPIVLSLILIGCGDATDTATPSTSSRSGNSAIRVDRTSVSSSALVSVGYDTEQQILEIEFHNGDVYQYFDVPQSVYDGLMNADSHGRYFHQHIRNAGFQFGRMDE